MNLILEHVLATEHCYKTNVSTLYLLCASLCLTEVVVVNVKCLFQELGLALGVQCAGCSTANFSIVLDYR